MQKSIPALCMCLALLVAPLAHAQTHTAGLVNNIISGCSTGMASNLCKGAMSRAQILCETPGNGGNCVRMLTDICRVRLDCNRADPFAVALATATDP